MLQKTGVLADAPLVFVVAATRYLPLESLPSWIPEIQEALRDRFPVFRRIRLSQTPEGVEATLDPSDFSPDHPGSAWLFTNPEHTLTVQIAKGALSLQTTAYVRFVDLGKDLTFVFDALMAKARHLNVESIGIRYVDHLDPKNGHSIEEYVPRQFLPFQWEGHGQAIGITSINSYKFGEDLLQVKFRTGTECTVIPEELMPGYFAGIDPKKLLTGQAVMPFKKLGATGASLDTDAIRNSLGGRKMETAEIVSAIDELHIKANSFFREACTDIAFADWQKGGRA